MGVRGLWKILEPTAQPVKLESLRGKTLAIDASIWIYHFLKAMRDTKGTVLAAAHIIGFFRRICKLLFYEIRPVFVFDGSPPILKKETTSRRNERRVNREQSARSTANKLLTIQLQRAQQIHKEQQNSIPTSVDDDDFQVVGSIPENALYLDDLLDGGTKPNKTIPSNKPFVKTDQYHLPEIGQIAPIRSDDQRLLTQEELDEYAAQFTSQARGGFIDTSLVDFKSQEFQRLPLETQYQLLNMARMKSRLRMGYTADELNKMFPNEMEFSRFQINRVAQRNFFTQRLMNLVGMEEDLTRRVSSEKNKEYFLKRTDHGWSLSLEGISQASKVEKEVKEKEEEEDRESDDEFEEVDIDTEPVDPKTVEPVTVDLENKDSGHAVEDVVDLTTAESAKLDELFGYEAQLSRNGLYSQLLNNLEEEEEEKENKEREEEQKKSQIDAKNAQGTNEKKGQPLRSLLFGSKTNVPWFDEKGNFEEMQISGQEDPNFVNVNEIESDLESEIVEVQSPPSSIAEPVVEKNQSELEPSSSESEPIIDTKKADKNITIEATESNTNEKKQPSPLTREEHTSDHFEILNHPESEDFLPTQKHISEQISLPEKEPDSPELQDKPKEASIDISEPQSVERAELEAQDDAEEEEQIAQALVAEAEENERFARTLAESTNKRWTQEDEADYQQQIDSLRKQFAKSTRDADNISTEMVQECQELLQLFGIPYITAPAEAEAQCAELRHLKLVDGIVTDDGDTFLFDDNTTVYRNMFSQAKFVEFYSTKEIKQKLGLDRHKLIDLAFLLGSDYTEGILGIGPVTGVEILAEFGDLHTFGKWWNEAQRFPDSVEINTKLKRRLLKQFGSKLFLPEEFPRDAVVQAYLHPAVDTDGTKFSWGTPDLDKIRHMLALTAGWSADKVNSVILPVVQETKRRELLRKAENAIDQSRINDFYTSVVQNPNLGSKRTAKAIEDLRKRQKN